MAAKPGAPAHISASRGTAGQASDRLLSSALGANPKRENACVATAMWRGADRLNKARAAQVDPKTILLPPAFGRMLRFKLNGECGYGMNVV